MPRYFSAAPRPLHVQNGRVLSSSERIDLDELVGCDIAHEQEGRLVLAPASEQPSPVKDDDKPAEPDAPVEPEPAKPSVKKTTPTIKGA